MKRETDMKTLYITDLDGTLLDANSQVSAEAVEVRDL